MFSSANFITQFQTIQAERLLGLFVLLGRINVGYGLDRTEVEGLTFV
jgi:hypothetical protein